MKEVKYHSWDEGKREASAASRAEGGGGGVHTCIDQTKPILAADMFRQSVNKINQIKRIEDENNFFLLETSFFASYGISELFSFLLCVFII